MKLKTEEIFSMEIDIRAKGFGKERGTKEDTMYAINYLAGLAREAGERYESLGLYALARNVKKLSSDLHQQLDDLGFYDR